jgi:hypothetical protein
MSRDEMQRYFVEFEGSHNAMVTLALSPFWLAAMNTVSA